MQLANFRLKYVIHRIACACFQVSDAARVHPVRERALRALNETVDYIDQVLPDAIGFETQKELIEYSLKNVSLDGRYLEFGVYQGGTISFMAKKLKPLLVDGFDSFEGLPEDWAGSTFRAGAFDVVGHLPRVPENVRLHKGWFNDTLPGWLKENSGPIAFIHVDCDLYSSTKTIFDFLGDRFQVGTIVLFDEYFNYPNWRNHEYKAFQEFVAMRNIRYTYLAYARQQVAVRIDSLDRIGS